MDFSYGAAFLESPPDAYERLLLDAMIGDPTLFIRTDEVEAAWHVCDPILTAWKDGEAPVFTYEAGTWGPKEADGLLAAGRAAMADTVTDPVRCIAEWDGERVDFGEVLEALDNLRRGDKSLATRISVVTLVAVASSEAEAVEAMATVHRFGAHHPGRSVVVLVLAGLRRPSPRRQGEPDRGERGRVGRSGSKTSSSMSTVRRPSTSTRSSSRSRCPMCPSPSGSCAGIPSRLIWNSRYYAPLTSSSSTPVGPAGSNGINEAIKRLPVIDLSWIRLRAWRLLLARAADASGADEVLRTVTEVTVSGSNGPRMLLTGWLKDRLGTGPTFRVGDGDAAYGAPRVAERRARGAPHRTRARGAGLRRGPRSDRPRGAVHPAGRRPGLGPRPGARLAPPRPPLRTGCGRDACVGPSAQKVTPGRPFLGRREARRRPDRR